MITRPHLCRHFENHEGSFLACTLSPIKVDMDQCVSNAVMELILQELHLQELHLSVQDKKAQALSQ